MKNGNLPTSKSYQTCLIKSLKNLDEAAAYLDVSLEEKDIVLFALALNHVKEAQIEQGLLNPEPFNQPSNLLSENDLASVIRLLDYLEQLGLQLTISVKQPAHIFESVQS